MTTANYDAFVQAKLGASACAGIDAPLREYQLFPHQRAEIYARWAEIHGECVYAVLDAVDCVLRAAEDDEK